MLATSFRTKTNGEYRPRKRKKEKKKGQKRKSNLTETETVRGALQIDVQQQNLGRLFFASRIRQASQQRGRQCIRWHQNIEASHKFAKWHVIRITLSVETDGGQQLRSAQLVFFCQTIQFSNFLFSTKLRYCVYLRAEQRHVQRFVIGSECRRTQIH